MYCNVGGPAYPAFAQFASLSAKHQLNIRERSTNTRRISELSAQYQRNISQSARSQINISDASANYQMRSQQHPVSSASVFAGRAAAPMNGNGTDDASRLDHCSSGVQALPNIDIAVRRKVFVLEGSVSRVG
jgi:hypothetical protein